MPDEKERIEPYLARSPDNLSDNSVFDHKYDFEKSESEKLEVKRPLGIWLLTPMALMIGTVVIAAIGFDYILKTGHFSFPWLIYWEWVADLHFPMQTYLQAIVGILFIAAGFLLWDGRRAGFSLFVFLMIGGMVASILYMNSLPAAVENRDVLTKHVQWVYAGHGIKIALHAVLILYFFHQRTTVFFRLDKSGMALRVLIAFLAVAAVFFGNRYFH